MGIATGVFDEEGVRVLLLGGNDEREQGLIQIDQHLRKPLCSQVRRQFPGLSSEDLVDCWQQTLVDVWQAVLKGNFDENKPLEPWLYRVAYHNAVDILRPKTSEENALSRVGEVLRGTSVGDWWSRLDPAERKEVLSLIQDHIAHLPYKQRVTIQAYVNNFDKIESIEDDLPDAVSKETGAPETVAAVKRALQEARRSIKELLQQKGYRTGEKT